MNPPLRTEEDRCAIITGLQDGTIDVIATDHAPHSSIEKDVEFPLALNGITGLETAVPLALKLVKEGHITPLRMIELMSCNPARILGLERIGSLKEMKSANITVIDPETTWTVSRETIFSKSINTPFYNKKLQGRAVLTICDGKVAFDRDNKIK
jgi:dihydroorotase